ncbi:MAG: sulfatase-like hydrolase/transferase, partial [Ekhidna sp.]|nr:sulfatase-like hydrolase/transferase [Ekhidna sp.]
SKMDADIGRLIAQLKASGQYENTLIIFTSDNGHEYDRVNDEFFDSNGPFRGRKRDLYDGGTHAPFVAHWPSAIDPGQSTSHLAAFWDLKATLGDLAGTPLKGETDGVSFLPTLLGKGDQVQHDYLYWEFNERKGPLQALLKGDWKLIHQVEKSAYELYNLQQDPSEKTDLSEQFPQELEELKSALATARTENDQFPLTRRPDPWKKK